MLGGGGVIASPGSGLCLRSPVFSPLFLRCFALRLVTSALPCVAFYVCVVALVSDVCVCAASRCGPLGGVARLSFFWILLSCSLLFRCHRCFVAFAFVVAIVSGGIIRGSCLRIHVKYRFLIRRDSFSRYYSFIHY